MYSRSNRIEIANIDTCKHSVRISRNITSLKLTGVYIFNVVMKRFKSNI